MFTFSWKSSAEIKEDLKLANVVCYEGKYYIVDTQQDFMGDNVYETILSPSKKQKETDVVSEINYRKVDFSKYYIVTTKDVKTAMENHYEVVKNIGKYISRIEG